MAKVLVVGGAGYIGGALTDQLLVKGHDVRVYDFLLYEDRYLKPIDFIRGDIRDMARLKPHLDWADSVVWLAALVGDGACSLDEGLTREINVDAVRAMVRSFNRQIVFMSTCSVYGAQDELLTEDSSLNPLSLYAITKHEAEQIVSGAGGTSFRLGTLFGLGDHFSRIRLDLVLNLLTLKACLYGRVSVFGGEQYRPLLHVRDVGAAITQVLGTNHRGVFNLHKDNLKISALADKIGVLFPGIAVEKTEIKTQDSRNYRVSSNKARNTFGFDPKLDVDLGIREVGKLVSEGRIRDPSDVQYSNFDYLRPVLVPAKSPLGGELPIWR
jgi:nucleoside-diphosphate-sugar epimerase